METTNTNDIDVIWVNSNQMIISTKDKANFIKTKTFENYDLNKEKYDRLFLNLEGDYYRFKENVDYISINIKEGYAIGKNGKKL